LDGLVEELRKTGLPISVSEKMDAAAALTVLDLADRAAVKSGLAAALVKSSEHESAYDTVFDLYFGQRLLETEQGDVAPGEDRQAGAEGGGPSQSGESGAALDGLDDAAIRKLLIDSLDAGEQSTLLQRSLARVLVTRHAGIQPGRAVAGTYYLFRAMRALSPDLVLARLVERAEQRLSGTADELTRRLLVDDAERKIAAFQQEIESEIRRRLVADRGVDAVAKTLRRPLPEDVDFLTASAEQMRALQDVLQPLARKLAARMGERRRHHRRGAIDFRKTIRRSLSSGGVPLDVYFHKPRPAKPELVVLADISGSVSAFAAFTLQLTYALRSQFARVRSFVFIDGMDDVTDLVGRARNILEVTGEINRLGLGVWLDGRSDYGNAFDTFWQRHGQELRQRTTVLVLGDSRTNYHASRADVLGKIAQRAGHVYWLNPEPRAAWDSGDSVIGQYARFCDGVFECRSLRQLRSFVERLG
jgi:uncharacterized protein with von Willebrand factor type A (vWA) domain